MNYIIFDLELNSKPFKNRHPNEIIEIGAVKLNDVLRTESVFQEFVRPRLYKKLFSTIKKKTRIAQSDIDNAGSLKEVLPRFKQWIGEEDYILCSWGHDDIHHLKQNCQLHRMSSKWLKKNFDIQMHFSKIYELPKGQRFSLEKALDVLGMTPDKKLHRAVVDAKYTAEIFRAAFDSMKPLVQ